MHFNRRSVARLAAALMGVLAVVAVMELALACAAAVRRIQRNHAAPAVHTIVCLGDSFTFGPGVPRQHRYPAQLESILNGGQVPRWRVVNAGQPANNSTQARMRLARLLKEEQPAAVALLIGWANHWNWRGFVAVTNQAVRAGFWRARALALLQRSRVFVLAQLLFSQAREARAARMPAPEARSLLHPDRRRELERLVQDAEAAPHVARRALAVCMFWLAEHQMEEAFKWAARAVACDPQDSWGYIGACKALITTSSRGEAYHWATNGLAHCPGTLELISYQVELDIDAGNADAALLALSNGLARAPRFAVFHQQAAMLAQRCPAYAAAARALTSGAAPEEDGVRPFDAQMQSADWVYTRGHAAAATNAEHKLAWVAHDIEAMLAMCAAANVPVILQTYPVCNDGTVRPCPADTLEYQAGLNRLLARIAHTHGVPLADHYEVFRQQRNRTALFLYGADEHPNGAGYALMASNLHAVITSVLPQVARR